MRGIVAGYLDHKTAWLLLYSLQLSTSNLAKQRDVFPAPLEPEEEEEEENNGHKSLAEILFERLREDPPDTFTEEEHKPHVNRPPVAAPLPMNADPSLRS